MASSFQLPVQSTATPASVYHSDNWLKILGKALLRTFARKFSNIDFFLQILPLKDDELVMSEM